MMQKYYISSFYSLAGVHYRIEVWKESDILVQIPQEVTLTDNPVEIEWSEVDKLEPLQCSAATLNLVSISDREFADLYSVEAATVRLDVYRDNTLYWSGTLDPELFEEPYSFESRYVTTVTFSDLATLDRKKWDKVGLLSIQQIIETCITAAGIKYTSITKNISTRTSGLDSKPISMSEIFVTCENFYDEDGESMTMLEVLEEVLKPFALKIVQRNGYIRIYDTNALCTQMIVPTQEVEWMGSDAMFEADKIYNNVKVTFSPYTSDALIDGSLEHDEVLIDQPIGESGELVYYRREANSPDGFRIVCGAPTEPLTQMILKNGAVLYRIDPEYSGTEEAGVMWGYRTGDNWVLNQPFNPFGVIQSPFTSKPIIETPRRYIAAEEESDQYRLRISLDTLFDVRYNPFEQADGENNEKKAWDKLEHWCNYAYVPFTLMLYDDTGKAVYYYTIYTLPPIIVPDADGNLIITGWHPPIQEWRAGSYTPQNERPSLWYYQENRENKSGLGGWQTNRQHLAWDESQSATELPTRIKLLADGEYIPMPPVSGYIVLSIYSGIHQHDNDANQVKDIYSKGRWMMYKNLKIDVVKANGRDIAKEDVEDNAWINKAANEDLEISTIFGTMPRPVPSARGLLLRKDGRPYNYFIRNGNADRLERLLIGTAYSQYAERKVILRGTARLTPQFTIMTDACESGKYINLGESQRLMQDESNICIAQFNEDKYTAIEYKNEKK